MHTGKPVEKDLAVFLETGCYHQLGIVAEVLVWLLGCIGAY